LCSTQVLEVELTGNLPFGHDLFSFHSLFPPRIDVASHIMEQSEGRRMTSMYYL
jgi:hypothetical protein